MNQLTEFMGTRQIDGEPRRRWFFSGELDLIVWTNDEDLPFKFQLCYDTHDEEHALTWEAGEGFDHASVDSGESSFIYKASPILVPNGPFDRARVLATFVECSEQLEIQIRNLVSTVLDAYPDSPDIAARRSMPLQESES